MTDFYLDVDGCRTHVTDVGVGSTIVLLHGAAVGVDSALTWFRTIGELSREFRLVTFDQVGFGRTDMPADGVYKNRFERTAHARLVLRELEVGPACLVGHSEGAFIAALLAITDPDLARSLMIVTSGGTAPYLGGAADAEWISACEQAYNDPTRLEDEDTFVSSDPHLSRGRDHRYEFLLRENFRRAVRSGQVAMFQEMPESEVDYQQYRELQETHVLPHLSQLDIPSLLVWAGEDPTVPVSRGLALQRVMPGADLEVLDDSGHYVMHDQTEAFHSLLRSLAGDHR
ncbi:MAG: alpha/beta hydrolase [Actinomycetota bacterium]|nr:alpha/beta hydrolase [Actinomycetota bacterium]